MLALVAAAQNALQAVLEEDQMPLLEQSVQETGPPIPYGNTVLVQASIGRAQVVQQETQQAFQLQDALQQSVGGPAITQESLHQRNLPAAMVVASLHV